MELFVCHFQETGCKTLYNQEKEPEITASFYIQRFHYKDRLPLSQTNKANCGFSSLDKDRVPVSKVYVSQTEVLGPCNRLVNEGLRPVK